MKALARGLASIAVIPSVLWFHARAWIVGRDRSLQATCEGLALIPGFVGQYVRRAFLRWTCEACGPDTVIGFGSVFSTTQVRLGANTYIGPQCNIGWAHIERDVLLAAGVHVPSGPNTHGVSRLDVPMRDQPGSLRPVRIDEGAWVGNGAVVMADVGRHAIVAAGAVVTKPVPDYAIAAGVPARVIRMRDQAGAVGE